MNLENLSEKELIKVYTNPFYCLAKVDKIFAQDHEPVISEELFIETGVKVIQEIGAAAYIKNLLENLKGNYLKG
jgi:hypothetical protein